MAVMERTFLEEIENLKFLYEQLDDENKNKLEEAIQMIVTKFKKRV